MDDLISRKAVAEKMAQRRDYVGRPSDPDCIIADEPSVPAVPLDKLCEWLTTNRVSIPCRLCEYDDAGKCTVQNDMSKPCPNTTRDWRRVITNWMEGLDDHR